MHPALNSVFPLGQATSFAFAKSPLGSCLFFAFFFTKAFRPDECDRGSISRLRLPKAGRDSRSFLSQCTRRKYVPPILLERRGRLYRALPGPINLLCYAATGHCYYKLFDVCFPCVFINERTKRRHDEKRQETRTGRRTPANYEREGAGAIVLLLGRAIPKHFARGPLADDPLVLSAVLSATSPRGVSY